MNIHEYQAKSLLAKYGVATPRGSVAYTTEEAVAAAREAGRLPDSVGAKRKHDGGPEDDSLAKRAKP